MWGSLRFVSGKQFTRCNVWCVTTKALPTKLMLWLKAPVTNDKATQINILYIVMDMFFKHSSSEACLYYVLWGYVYTIWFVKSGIDKRTCLSSHLLMYTLCLSFQQKVNTHVLIYSLTRTPATHKLFTWTPATHKFFTRTHTTHTNSSHAHPTNTPSLLPGLQL